MASRSSSSGAGAVQPAGIRLHGTRRLGDRVFRGGVSAAAALVVILLAAIAVFLIGQGWPALRHYGVFSFLASDRWAPSDATAASTHPNPYGILQFIYGTALTSVIGMLIALPVAVAAGLFITQYAPAWLRRPLSRPWVTGSGASSRWSPPCPRA